MSTMKLATLSVLIPLAMATPLIAQDRAERDGPRMMFETLDLDGDGVLTMSEVENAGPAHFAANDTDGDGLLSRAELIAAGQARFEARADRMLERADADGDGALSQEEMAQTRAGRRGPDVDRMFGRMDADEDGTITRAEFDRAADRFMGRHGSGGRGHDRG